MSDPIAHSAIPPIGWHGARIIEGTDAAKGMPEIIGQLYKTTDLDPNIVYIAAPDLSGWDLLTYVALDGTPPYTGIQTHRSPALSVANNTNTSINHSSDTIVYDHGAIKGGAAVFTIPAGKGGLWSITADVKWSSGFSTSGRTYVDIENSIGSAAGFIAYDGSLLDSTQFTGLTLAGELELPAGATFNLRVYHQTGGFCSLNYYRIAAHLIGVP